MCIFTGLSYLPPTGNLDSCSRVNFDRTLCKFTCRYKRMVKRKKTTIITAMEPVADKHTPLTLFLIAANAIVNS